MTITYNVKISKPTEFRMRQLRAMDDCIMTCNDEEIFDEWNFIVPNRLNLADLQSIAMDDEAYHDVCNLFTRLVSFDNFRI